METKKNNSSNTDILICEYILFYFPVIILTITAILNLIQTNNTHAIEYSIEASIVSKLLLKEAHLIRSLDTKEVWDSKQNKIYGEVCLIEFFICIRMIYLSFIYAWNEVVRSLIPHCVLCYICIYSLGGIVYSIKHWKKGEKKDGDD